MSADDVAEDAAVLPDHVTCMYCRFFREEVEPHMDLVHSNAAVVDQNPIFLKVAASVIRINIPLFAHIWTPWWLTRSSGSRSGTPHSWPLIVWRSPAQAFQQIPSIWMTGIFSFRYLHLSNKQNIENSFILC